MQVQVKNLTMHYNDAGRVVEIFKDLNLKVASGDSLAIMGQSGVGKTTLLYLLGGLETPVSGEVLIGETSLHQLKGNNEFLAKFRGENVGFIFQFHNLLAEFSALENVAMPLLIKNVSWDLAKEKAATLLCKVGLEQRLTHRPTELSGGEQQRVAIARALVTSPGLILADEPTGNLDPKTGKDIRDLLLQLQEEEEITLILVTHSLELASRMKRVVELTFEGIKEKKV